MKNVMRKAVSKAYRAKQLIHNGMLDEGVSTTQRSGRPSQ